MGRRQAVQLDLALPEDDPPVERASEPPPWRHARAKPETGPAGRFRRVLLWSGAVLLIVALVFAIYRLDEYLATDSHFALRGDTQIHPDLSLTGVVHAPSARIIGVFREDFGRSIYLLPLAERRRALLAIDWVRDASVSRRWPNRVAVCITERTPVAFALLPAGGLKLIDEDGALLDPPPRAVLDLPVLRGVSAEEPPSMRRESVRQALTLIREAEAYAGQISEINVSDPENLKVMQVVEGRPIRLQLGSEHYLSRLKNFFTHYPDIGRRLPGARAFDLRLDDRIILEANPDAR